MVDRGRRALQVSSGANEKPGPLGYSAKVPVYDLTDVAYPLVHANPETMSSRPIGSAFTVEGTKRALLTAGHVLDALENGGQLETFGSTTRVGGCSTRIGEGWHRHASLDLAANIAHSVPAALRISPRQPTHDTDLYTIEWSRTTTDGGPLRIAAFSNVLKGHLVSIEVGDRVGFDGHPELYRVSFPAPRGASGAPVLRTSKHGPPVLVGMVIGQHSTRMGDEEPLTCALVLPAQFIATFLTELGYEPAVA